MVGALTGALTVPTLHADDKTGDKGEWLQLFNGKDLTGWTPKFKGQDLGIVLLVSR